MAELDYGTLFIAYLVLLFSLSTHESAHAWAADRLGDPTSRRLGRISLNPLVHIDPVGTVLLPLVAFASGAPVIGWAKPVPVNLLNLGNHRRDYVLVAAAGPASNLGLALFASVVLRLAPSETAAVGPLSVGAPLMVFAGWALTLNLLLAVFNMLPIPPLDGGNVLGGLLPDRLADQYDRVRPYGFLVLYGLLLTGTLGTLLGPPYRLLSGMLSP